MNRYYLSRSIFQISLNGFWYVKRLKKNRQEIKNKPTGVKSLLETRESKDTLSKVILPLLKPAAEEMGDSHVKKSKLPPEAIHTVEN